MEKKKVAFILLITVGALSLILQSSSYTSAQMNNSVSLRIVSSEKALISLRKNIELNCAAPIIGVKNNMALPITLKSTSFAIDADTTLSVDETEIKSGEARDIPLVISGDMRIGRNLEQEKFEFTWDGGSAIISVSVHQNDSVNNDGVKVEQQTDPDENSMTDGVLDDVESSEGKLRITFSPQ